MRPDLSHYPPKDQSDLLHILPQAAGLTRGCEKEVVVEKKKNKKKKIRRKIRRKKKKLGRRRRKQKD